MSTSANAYNYIRNLVASKSGNVLSESQNYLIDNRVGPVSKQAGFNSLEEFVAYLRVNATSPLTDSVAEAMTINETSFFRDRLPFDVLRSHVFPQIASRPFASRRLSLWSAACASGQEPYSLAMTALETAAVKEFYIQILATDISDTMVGRTRDAVYTDFEVRRGLSTDQKRRYFLPANEKWQIKPELQTLVQTMKANLLRLPIYVSQYDVVFLRNVLLYFDKPTKELILNNIRRHIRDNGYLFLGGGETMIGMNVPFKPETIGRVICYRPV